MNKSTRLILITVLIMSVVFGGVTLIYFRFIRETPAKEQKAGNPGDKKSGDQAESDADKNLGKANGDKINIRKSPTINADVLGILKKGEEVEILDETTNNSNNEAILKEDTKFYYAEGDYASVINEGRAVKIESYSSYDDTYQATIEYKGKTINATIKSKSIEFISNDKWYKIKNAKGSVGYCLEKYIDLL